MELPPQFVNHSIAQSSSASPHEMHDLQPIPFMKLDLSPALSIGKFSIQFYGDAIALEPEAFDELRERRAVGTALRFAIHNDGHKQQCS